jgi:hypothetical protein
MITSTSSTDRSSRPEHLTSAAPFQPRLQKAPSDQISTENAEFLRAELKRQPEIRPEVIERARALVIDPSYPNLAVLRSVAAQILSAPDLSEDMS